MSKKSQDLTGLNFGYYTALHQDGCDSKGVPYWLCRCKCGNEKRVWVYNLLRGHTRSCGCLQREKLVTHGCTHEPWFPTYMDMMQRCGHWKGASERDLRLYRDRGITVCEEWQKSPRAFGDWLLAHGWAKGLEVDRIDNNQGYSPENCRLLSHRENNNNRRNTLRLDDGTPLAMFCSSVGIETYEGGSITLKYSRIKAMWARRHKIHPELMQALKENVDKQSRLLEITKLKRRHAELMIAGLKELLRSKQTVL